MLLSHVLSCKRLQLYMDPHRPNLPEGPYRSLFPCSGERETFTEPQLHVQDRELAPASD